MVWRGAAGWAEWSPFLDYAGPELVPLAAGRRRGRRAGLAGAACATEVAVNSTIPAVGPEQAYARARAGRLPDGQGQGRRGRPVAGRRPGPGRGGARRARCGRPDPGGRQRRLVAGPGPGRGHGAGPVRPGVRRAALPDGRRAGRAAAPAGPGRDRRAGRGRRVDPPGRGPVRGRRARQRPTSPCSRCSRWAGSGPRLGIAERIGLPVVVSSALETSIGLRAGLALAAALPELPYACGLNTAGLLAGDLVAEPLTRGGRGDPAARGRAGPGRAGPAPGRPGDARGLAGPVGPDPRPDEGAGRWLRGTRPRWPGWSSPSWSARA